VTPDLLTQLVEARSGRKAVAVIKHLESGHERLVAKAELHKDPLWGILETAFRFDKSGVQQTDEGEVFITIHNPKLRLVIIGAVLIAQSVIPMAQAADYDVTVVDPRGAFATDARFPDVPLHVEWPDEVLPKLGLDARTALLALTHDPKIDDAALQNALKSDVFYIGALGSKKTQAARVERLRASGFVDDAIARIHGPIGLNIGAMGAAEIAISIVAEMTKALRLGV
jgi:xanthine dehydrogenase accessory factor